MIIDHITWKHREERVSRGWDEVTILAIRIVRDFTRGKTDEIRSLRFCSRSLDNTVIIVMSLVLLSDCLDDGLCFYLKEASERKEFSLNELSVGLDQALEKGDPFAKYIALWVTDIIQYNNPLYQKGRGQLFVKHFDEIEILLYDR